jgi:nucleotide-binding universal stress UspA family protein
MDIKRILFPTDFSECSSGALDCASSRAGATGARLYILYVDELKDVIVPAFPPAEGDCFYSAAWDDERRELLHERLTKTIPTVVNVAYERRFLTGSPLVEILKFAEQESVNLIVMGSHGRTWVSRLIMGGIAQGVMRGAKCPILIVKQPAVVTEDVSKTASTGTPR